MGPGYSFEVIDAELLMAEVDLIPAGLRQLSDMQSRLNQASIVQNTALVHPLLMQNLPALAIILDQFLQATGIPQRQKIMALVEQYVQGVEQAMQEQQPCRARTPCRPRAQDQGGGNNPGLQGAQGNNNRPATSPTPPPGPQDNLPPGRMSDATAQTVAG
jgi:hypothetical protein